VKSLLLALSMSMAALTLAVSPLDVEAKRLGAGKPAGMQRQMPAKPADATPHSPAAPAQNAAAPAAPAPAPAAAPGKRSWMGPIAGLAAGLGIAALFSHFGMGAGLANFMMMALLAVVAVVAVRWLLSRFAGGNRGPALAGAGAGGTAGNGPAWQPAPAAQPLQREAFQPLQAATPAAPLGAPVSGAAASTAAATPAVLPGGMAQAEFLRLAKMVFVRLQAANDAGNVDDLRKFTTPELFASLRVDMQERGASANVTDVVQLDAEVADVSQQNGQDIVSVRFHGLIREAAAAPTEPFSELWHMVRPASGGDWAIAGITPLQ